MPIIYLIAINNNCPIIYNKISSSALNINNFGFYFVVPVNYNEWNFCDGNNDCPEGLDLCQPHEIATGGKFNKIHKRDVSKVRTSGPDVMFGRALE